MLILLGLAVAWRWTPLGDWLQIDRLAGAAAALKTMPAAPLAVIGAYIVAGFLVIPLTALVIATALVFGPVASLAYALIGAALSALCTYMLGRALGRKTVRRFAGRRVNRISRRVARRGVFAVAAIRMLPLAPFTIVNMVAGASHIGLRDFMLGTIIGLAPGMAAISFFVDGIAAAINEPSAATVSLLAGIVVVIALGAVLARRYLGAPAASSVKPNGGEA